MSDETPPFPPAGPEAAPGAGLLSRSEPEPEPGYESGTEPDALPESASGKGRRGLALGVAAAIVAVAAGGGIGYVLLHRGGGTDAKPVAQPWKAPEPKRTGAFGVKAGGSHYGALRKLLLPVPGEYQPGPDVGEYGNDVELDAKQTEAQMKNSTGKLFKKNRATMEKAVARLHVEGSGIRTYSSADSDFYVQMTIVQMKNKQAAAARSEFFAEFTRAMGIFRNGPQVAGHDRARCVLPPTEPGGKLDSMVCQATEGDLLVTMNVYGVRPLKKDDAVLLFKQQLDRIQDPGEAA